MSIERQLYIHGLLSASGWDEIDFCINLYYDVIFQRDFGLFKEGEEYDSVTVDYVQQKILTYNAEGKVIQQVSFTLEPK
jgi:hypothetical protein